jgi:degradative hydroxymethylglutaryl-CoA reductase
MNGIDAVAVACGQDWRAIEAAAHGWAATGVDEHQSYKPLTRYWLEQDPSPGNRILLCGEINIPLMVGTKGGVLKTNPTYTYSLGLLGNPTSSKLARVIVFLRCLPSCT